MYRLFIKYDNYGEIISKLSLPAEDVEIILGAKQEGENFLEVTDEQFRSINETYYIASDGSLTNKIKMPIIQSDKVFTNIPISVKGTTLTISGVTYPVTDTTVDLNIDTPGTYTVIFKGFPYMDTIFLVTV